MFTYKNLLSALGFREYPDQLDSENLARMRRAILSISANMLSKVVTMSVLLLSTRIAMPLLGPERFGIWATISSLAVVLVVLDLGISNGMVTQVSIANAGQNSTRLKSLASNGMLLLSCIGAALAGILCLFVAFSPIDWLFRNSTTATLLEARQALIEFAVLFGISLPLQGAQRIYSGLQRSYITFWASAGAGLISLTLLPVLQKLGAGVPAFLMATYGVQVLSGFVLVVGLFREKLLELDSLKRLSDPVFLDLISNGGLFFILQIAVIIGWSGDSALLSALLGPAVVAQFAVAQRLYMFVSLPLSILNAPLWSIYAEAHARRNVKLIRKMLLASLCGTAALGTIGVLILSLTFPSLGAWLSHDLALPPPLFVYLYGAWVVIDATGNALAMYMNGVHVLWPQVVSSLSFVCISLILKLILIPLFGLTALPAITVFLYLLLVAGLYATVFRRQVFAAAVR